MERHKRTKAIKALIDTGEIKNFIEIFDDHEFPVTTMAEFLGTNFKRLRKYIDKPGLFTINEICTIAGYFQVDERKMIDLVYNQHARKIKRK